jgi:hypothetical protein
MLRTAETKMVRSPGKLLILLGLVGYCASVARSAEPVHQVQEGPSGYTVACALTDQPHIHNCADLPSAQACAHEPELPSAASQQATGMTFVNRSDRAITIYWIDYQGYRRLYHSVAPGGRITQNTFIGHYWLVATSDGQCVGVFKAAPESLAFF